MPAVQKGWEMMGLYEGVHYIRGKEPPASWKAKCSIIVNDYRNCYSFWNGSVVFMGSLDNPSLLAGKSVVHLFYDESKYDKDEKVNRAMPVLRGDSLTYGASHLFLGLTITTDMPDVNEGEYDWYFRYAPNMDPDRIILIVQAAFERNGLLLKQLREQKKDNPSRSVLARLERKIDYYDRALRKLRRGQTFFLNASSLVNVDILTPEYIRNLYQGTLELHEFCKSVLGMRPGLRRDVRFYVLFGQKHKYYDGSPGGEPAENSRELRYLRHDKPLDGGMDFGNMLSFVIGQEDGAYYRCHKNFSRYLPGGSVSWLTSSWISLLHMNVRNCRCIMTEPAIILKDRGRIMPGR